MNHESWFSSLISVFYSALIFCSKFPLKSLARIQRRALAPSCWLSSPSSAWTLRLASFLHFWFERFPSLLELNRGRERNLFWFGNGRSWDWLEEFFWEIFAWKRVWSVRFVSSAFCGEFCCRQSTYANRHSVSFPQSVFLPVQTYASQKSLIAKIPIFAGSLPCYQFHPNFLYPRISTVNAVLAKTKSIQNFPLRGKTRP